MNDKQIFIVLASGSPRRRELLALAGYDFVVIPSRADENIEMAEPDEYVKRLAAMKAREVCDRVTAVLSTEPNDHVDAGRLQINDETAAYIRRAFAECGELIVLGADTVVSYEGRILGKPSDRDDARNMLRMLSGQTHQVYTGVCLICMNCGKKGAVENTPAVSIDSDAQGNGLLTENIFAERTDVSFYDIPEDELEMYLDTDEPYDKAGSYGIQGRGGLFVRGICGDYNNVVGLPLARVYHEIKANK